MSDPVDGSRTARSDAAASPIGTPTHPGDPADAAATLARVSAGLFGASEPSQGRIGRYELREAMGRGGMGVVYAAYDPDLDRRVALKLQPGQPRADKRERALHEARTLARLQHPNVVTVHEVGLHEDAVFIAMAFVEGETLDAWVARAQPSRKELWEAIAMAAEGLMAAHREGLVHGDVKPSNLIRTATGRVVLIDFGLAREHFDPEETGASTLASGEATRRSTFAFGGTPGYAAPEQSAGAALVPASDQYALAATAWRLLSGRLPHEGTHPPSMGRRESSALRRALRSAPADRFSDVRAFVEAARPRRRWRAPAYGIAGAALAAVAFAQAWPEPAPAPARPEDPCPRELERWSLAASPSLTQARAQLESKAGTLGARWRWIGEQLDQAQAQLDARAGAICADHRDGELDDRSYAAYAQCLDRGSDAVRLLAESFERPPEDPRHLLDRVTHLVVVDDCGPHRDALIREQAAAASQIAAHHDPELNRFATETLHLFNQRKVEEARARLAELERRVDASKDAFSISEAHRVWGLVSPDDAAAEAHLWTAFETSMERRFDARAIIAATDLAELFSHRLQRPDEARRVLKLALAWAQSIFQEPGGEHRRVRIGVFLGRAENQMGILESDAGRLDAAEAHYKRALELWAPSYIMRPGRTAGAQNNLAELALQRGDLDEALSRFGQAIETLESLAPAHGWLPLIRINRAAVRLLRGDREGARDDLDAAARSDNPMHHELEAELAWSAGDVEGAAAAWAKAIEGRQRSREPWMEQRGRLLSLQAQLWQASPRARRELLTKAPVRDFFESLAPPEARAETLLTVAEAALDYGEVELARRWIAWASQALEATEGPAPHLHVASALARVRADMLEGAGSSRAELERLRARISDELTGHANLRRGAWLLGLELGLPVPARAAEAASTALGASRDDFSAPQRRRLEGVASADAVRAGPRAR